MTYGLLYCRPSFPKFEMLKNILLLLSLFSVYALAEDYDIVVKWQGGVNTTTAWTIDGKDVFPINVNGASICHYVGQVIGAAQDGQCGTLTIRHLAKVDAEYEDDSNPRKWLGLHCYYDYNKVGGGYHWRIANLRQNCPDILVSALINGTPKVIAEYFFQEGENQAIYYEDGKPIDQTMNTDEDIVAHFGETYCNQIDYRNYYDWVKLKPIDRPKKRKKNWGR